MAGNEKKKIAGRSLCPASPARSRLGAPSSRTGAVLTWFADSGLISSSASLRYFVTGSWHWPTAPTVHPSAMMAYLPVSVVAVAAGPRVRSHPQYSAHACQANRCLARSAGRKRWNDERLASARPGAETLRARITVCGLRGSTQSTKEPIRCRRVNASILHRAFPTASSRHVGASLDL